MNAAGYVLTGMRRHRRRAHSPHVLAHSLTTAFFGVEELASWFPDYESFAIWPATARLIVKLRRLDRHELAGRSSLEHFAHWWNPSTRRAILCSRREARRICHRAATHLS
jgi:hypothetical protein